VQHLLRLSVANYVKYVIYTVNYTIFRLKFKIKDKTENVI
jgi:hypothetical protein